MKKYDSSPTIVKMCLDSIVNAVNESMSMDDRFNLNRRSNKTKKLGATDGIPQIDEVM